MGRDFKRLSIRLILHQRVFIQFLAMLVLVLSIFCHPSSSPWAPPS